MKIGSPVGMVVHQVNDQRNKKAKYGQPNNHDDYRQTLRCTLNLFDRSLLRLWRRHAGTGMGWLAVAP
jgi:hypothetical protein